MPLNGAPRGELLSASARDIIQRLTAFMMCHVARCSTMWRVVAIINLYYVNKQYKKNEEQRKKWSHGPIAYHAVLDNLIGLKKWSTQTTPMGYFLGHVGVLPCQ